MKLANERTLELNITHQLINFYRFSYAKRHPRHFPFLLLDALYATSPTIREESKKGYDVALKLPYSTLFYQFKAPKNSLGIDGKEAHFEINNNTKKDQHQKLRALVSRNQSVLYAFPLVVSDKFFTSQAQFLMHYTQFIGVNRFPAYSDNLRHKVEVYEKGKFTAHSQEFNGEGGLTAIQLIEAILDRELGYEVSRENLDGHLEAIRSFLIESGYENHMLRLLCFHPISPFVYRFRI
jgi:hypothetical protein